MTYSILVEVCAIDRHDNTLPWEGRWIPLEQREEGEYIAELKVTTHDGHTLVELEEPTANELRLFTRFAYAERVLEAASAWRYAHADGTVATATLALMAALEGTPHAS